MFDSLTLEQLQRAEHMLSVELEFFYKELKHDQLMNSSREFDPMSHSHGTHQLLSAVRLEIQLAAVREEIARRTNDQTQAASDQGGLG